jgi:hypothetical protein
MVRIAERTVVTELFCRCFVFMIDVTEGGVEHVERDGRYERRSGSVG